MDFFNIIDELYTALTEVKSILNTRLLSFVFSYDLEEPLTPHLLMGRRLLSMPDNLGVNIDPVDEDFSITSTSTQLKDRVKQLNGTLNFFWSRWWHDEYLLELRKAHRYFDSNHGSCYSVSVGDVVIIHYEILNEMAEYVVQL